MLDIRVIIHGVKMCCNTVSSFILCISLTFIVLLGTFKLSNQKIECEINKGHVLFSVQASPRENTYNLVLSTEMSKVGNVNFIHEIFVNGGGRISILYL